MESEQDEESQDQKSLNIIRVEYEDPYETIGVSSGESLNTTVVKGKYYKQTYRPAWEHMPDFKGWLRGVQGEPTRAYCTYCQKTLHAHRLSLLKHTCTIRHQKAAQLHNSRANKTSQQQMEQQIRYIEASGTLNEEVIEGEDLETIEYTSGEIEDGEQEQEIEREQEVEEEEETVVLENLPVQFQKQIRHATMQQPMSGTKPPISTYVCDTTRGIPVSGLQVSLYKLIDGRWTYINEGVTNQEGTFSSFIDRGDFTIGRYKLHFDVDRFFEARKQDTLYPFIEIVFDCRNVSEYYNVPLLLNPFGYSTYKGT